MGHTPGPWVVSGILDRNRKYESVNADGPRAIASVHVFCDARTDDPTDPGIEETKANARLIAAAPDLLTALTLCEGLIAKELEAADSGQSSLDVDCIRRVLAQTRAAIAKAT